MSSLQYFNAPGAGTKLSDGWGYSQSVIVDNVVKLSGQGGWDAEGNLKPVREEDYELEAKNVFENVERELAAAGLEGGWANVYLVRSYHVELSKTLEIVNKLLKEKAPHRPTWTVLGVAELAIPGMNLEIEVEAYRGKKQ